MRAYRGRSGWCGSGSAATRSWQRPARSASRVKARRPVAVTRTAQLAARALTPDELAPSRCRAAAPPTPVARARRRSRASRMLARLRDRIAALERVCRELRAARSRATARVLRARAGHEPAHVRAFFVAGGRVAAERTLPPAAVQRSRSRPASPPHATVQPSNRLLQGDRELDLDELLLVDSFLRRPPPELRVAPLGREAICDRGLGSR